MKKQRVVPGSLPTLVTKAIPDYRLDNDGDAWCCAIHWSDSWRFRTVEIPRVIAAIQAIPEEVADTVMTEHWSDRWKGNDPIDVISSWGWGAGPPNGRTVHSPLYIAGQYSEALSPTDFVMLETIAPFVVNDAHIVFSTGRHFDRTDPGFVVGVNSMNGTLWFSDDVSSSVEYDIG